VDVIHPRCAGLDISKKDAKVCVRINGAGRRKTSETVTTFGATTRQILSLREHLAAQRVTCVVMEATSDYWKPFYYLLEDLPAAEVMLVNARHVKNLPGRKTDVADATWLAQLGAHGLVRGSFVPPAPIRQLRDLTRTRTAVTRERTREIQRLEKLLEDAGIKLSSVVCDLTGVSGRAMLEALIAGDTDPAAMAELAKKRMRVKIPQLTEALYGRFTSHHAFLTRMHLDLIDQHTAAIEQLTDRIEVVIEPFRGFRDLICTIPGIGGYTADVIVAETGADMTRFPTAQHLASWAGTTPANNESAGKVKSRRTRPGNPYLQGALGTAAMSISHNPRHLRGCQISPDRRPPGPAQSQRRHSTRAARRDLEHRHDQHHLPRPRRRLLHPPQPAESPKQRRPPTRSHGLSRHPRPGILTEPLTPQLTSRESSRQVGAGAVDSSSSPNTRRRGSV
jgi:transposase